MATRRRPPGRQLVNFASSFFSDLKPEGLLYAVLIRSPLSMGRIRSITHPHLPEGYFLYTAKDIPGSKTISILGTSIPLLADETVSYQGEPLGILVGPDKIDLQQLAKEVVIRFHKVEERSLSTEVLEPQDIIACRTLSDGGDAELLFAEADIPLEGSYSSNCYSSQCGEAAGGLALYKGETLVLYAPVQWFSQVRRSIAAGLGILPQQVEIRKTLAAGGRNNSQWYSAILSAQVAMAAYLCRKPVRILLTREEQELYYERPAPVVVNYRSSVAPNGRILALIASIVVDTGIYNPFINDLISRMVVASWGVYNPPVYKIEAYAVRSQTPPTALTLQRMDSQIFFALETHLYEIARRVGRMPHEVRLLNHVVSPSKPFKFNFTHLEKVIQAVVDKSSFQRKYWSFSLTREDSPEKKLTSPVPVRGIGLSCAFEGSGFMGAIQYTSDLTMELTLEKDGSVAIHTYPPSPSIRDIWIKIVSKELDVPEANIHIDGNFHPDSEPLHPAGFFGNVGIMTQLLRKCCTAIQKKRFQQALPIHVSRGLTSSQKKQWDQESFSGEPFFTTATGAATAEVELDPYTFKTILRGIWIAIEGGEILSKERAISTIKAAVRESLCELVLMEEIEVKDIFVELLPGSKEPKQLGGLVYSLLPSAVAAAISQAYNTVISSIPLEYNYVCQALSPCQSKMEGQVLAGEAAIQEEAQ